jgi:hypothetical protein
MYSEEVRQRASELLATGLSLNRTSQELGVSRAAIRDWRDHPERPAAAPCPAPAAPSAAYAALLGFYLGDGCVSRVRSVYSLRISCDLSYPGIIADVRSCVLAVHPERRTYIVPAPGIVNVQSLWKHWPCLFPQHGPGRKHERYLGMSDWQWAIVEEFPADFLRGLFHSDGCRVDNWATAVVAGERKRYEYCRWQFSNRSEEILGWCGDALDLLDIPWRRSSRWAISVSRREGVEALDRLIGPKR